MPNVLQLNQFNQLKFAKQLNNSKVAENPGPQANQSKPRLNAEGKQQGTL